MDINKKIEETRTFPADKVYISHKRFLNVLGQVHSVVETEIGHIILRVWLGKPLGPEGLKAKRVEKLFRLEQQHFKRYMAEPDKRIGTALNKIGKENLIEIDVFDEYVENTKELKSGDYIVITNLHYQSKDSDIFVLHGGGEKYKRCITKIDEDCVHPLFQEFRAHCSNLMNNADGWEEYSEFTEKEKEENIERKRNNEKMIMQSPPMPKKIESIDKCQAIVLNKLIAVDCFRKNTNAKYHFLTHGHSDHCRGLNSKWNKTIYCTQKTANIIPLIMGVPDESFDKNLVHVLETNEIHKFEEFDVTVLDANHCPGAVMYLFEGAAFPDGAVLCTGDFRADKDFLVRFEWMEVFFKLRNTKLAAIYLDNTYLDFDRDFPEKEEAYKTLLQTCKDYDNMNVYIPLHRLGREEMLENLSKDLEEPIAMYDKKLAFASKLNYRFDFGEKRAGRNIVVVERSSWKITELPEKSICFDISMINESLNAQVFEAGRALHDRMFHISYTDHSSRAEILAFLQKLQFANVVPCSQRMSVESMAAVMKLAKVKIDKKAVQSPVKKRLKVDEDVENSDEDKEEEEEEDKDDDVEMPEVTVNPKTIDELIESLQYRSK